MVDSLKSSSSKLQVQKAEPKPAPAPAPAPAPEKATGTGTSGTSSFQATAPDYSAKIGSGVGAAIGSASIAVKDSLASTLTTSGVDGNIRPQDFGKKIEDPKPSDVEENQDVTQDMTPRETAAYDKLNEQDRARYNETHRAAQEAGPEAVENVEQLLVEGNVDEYLDVVDAAGPEEAEKAQDLLFKGTLIDDKDRGNKSMLDHLAACARGTGETTGQGVNRQQLINQIITDVHDQSGSTQDERSNDCGGLTILGDFAREAPAAYAAGLVELAEKGEFTVRDGEGKEVKLTYGGPPNPNHPEGLNVTQQIFVDAFARAADVEGNGGGLGGFLKGIFDGFDGMKASEVARLKELAFGQNYEPMTVPDQEEAEARAREELGPSAKPEEVAARAAEIRAETSAEAIETIDEQLAAGENPQVMIDGHWQTVTEKKTLHFLGKEITYYVVDDGQGGKRAVFPDDLKNKTEAVIFNPDVSKVPEGSYVESEDDPGQGNNAGAGQTDPDDP